MRAPAQGKRIKTPRGFNKPGANVWVEVGKRMPRRVAGDDAAFLKQDFARKQSTLTVLVVDQWQPSLVGVEGFIAASIAKGVDNLPDAIGISGAGHRSGGAGVQIGKQRDA